MYIKSLRLSSFRNYNSLNINFAKNFNIIYGYNAQGKTNIIEAVFLCASGRSHRTAKDHELIEFGHQGYFIKTDFIKENVESSVEVSYVNEGKKKIKVNDVPIVKIGNLMGHLNAVVFSPEDLLIIKEGPAERRRFIDITISQLKPSYFYDLQQYSKVLTQRNTLLKDIQTNKYLFDTLEIWNNKLVSIGSKIIKVRREFIKRLSIIAKENHYKLTSGVEKLFVSYAPSVIIDENESLSDIEKRFIKELEAAFRKEMARGSTLVGPQRDDYELFIDDMNLKQYGSQGQQRTAVLSIKLSEIKIMKEDTDEYPVLLLDDVMSELDRKRQEYLFENLKEIQTFITCTELDFIKDKVKLDYQFFNVNNGKINEGL